MITIAAAAASSSSSTAASKFHFPSTSLTFSSSHKTDHCSLLPFSKISSYPMSPSLHTLKLETSTWMTGGTKSRGRRALFCIRSRGDNNKELLVKQLLVEDPRLQVQLQKKIIEGADFSELAKKHSICPFKEEGGMLGWVRKGILVPEVENAVFRASVNSVVRCNAEFGWHLLQVLDEREGVPLKMIQPEELHHKMQDEDFVKSAQLIDVREPDEVERVSLRGFKVYPVLQFGTWRSRITEELDPEKDTYVMCHRGTSSERVALWLLTRGFKNVFYVVGGIHAYALKADSSIPTYW